MEAGHVLFSFPKRVSNISLASGLRCLSVLCRWCCHLWAWGLLSVNKDSGCLIASPAPQYLFPLVISHRSPALTHFPPQCWWPCSRQVCRLGNRGYKVWVKLSLISSHGSWHGIYDAPIKISEIATIQYPWVPVVTLICLYLKLCLWQVIHTRINIDMTSVATITLTQHKFHLYSMDIWVSKEIMVFQEEKRRFKWNYCSSPHVHVAGMSQALGGYRICTIRVVLDHVLRLAKDKTAGIYCTWFHFWFCMSSSCIFHIHIPGTLEPGCASNLIYSMSQSINKGHLLSTGCQLSPQLQDYN